LGTIAEALRMRKGENKCPDNNENDEAKGGENERTEVEGEETRREEFEVELAGFCNGDVRRARSG
jgi:hypothetical protein